MCRTNSPQDDQNLKTPLVITNCPQNAETHNTKRQTLLFLAIKESISISNISIPMILSGLLLYLRSLISMLFLGHLGDLSLAGGSLAVGFANITGYSLLSGLALGMEPICGQAFGANKLNLIGLTLQRTILLLIFTSIPISILWLNIKPILISLGQDADLATQAQTFLIYSIPDLLAQSLLHPLRIYLRTQAITVPLSICAAFAIVLHVPISYVLVSRLRLGLTGVALSGVWTNFNLVVALVLYISISGVYKSTWHKISSDCFKEWRQLLNLAVPSCVSVCLEWWWYEIMILLCGLLHNPKATVASMGILIQTTSLIYIFPSSLSFGVSTRVGNELGANRPRRAKAAAIAGLCLSFLLGITALFFSVSVRNIWGRVFTDDETIIAMTSAALPIIGLCELGNCPQTTGCGVLRGSARPKTGANINLACFYVVGMPVSVFLGFFRGFGLRGMWFGMFAAQSSCLMNMLIVIARTDWEKEAGRAAELTGRDGEYCGKVLVGEDDKKNLFGDSIAHCSV